MAGSELKPDETTKLQGPGSTRLLAHGSPQLGAEPRSPKAPEPERTNPEQPRLEPQVPERLGLPAEIGPYRLLEVLGRGGMGMVMLAEQEAPIRRQVAIKIILPRARASVLRHRFEFERRALARLDHPNIAKVFEAGDLPDGRPYFVMERIEGKPLDSFCSDRHLGLRDRLELFQQVCAGVHHAHQKGILHRDLKPSNILVTEQDGQPSVKIIDFGIAHDLRGEETRLTRNGVVGTPAFLSPESLSFADDGTLEQDIRSDVYALGILLFLLLVGSLPLASHKLDLLGLVERLKTQPLPCPSHRWKALPRHDQTELARTLKTTPQQHYRRLRGDLDTVFLKATVLERQHRYSSAADLAADLQRYLSGHPVQAVPAKTSYRLAKFLRRHRAAAAAALLLLTALVGGIVARTIEADRARRAALDARQALAEAREVRDLLLDTLGDVQSEHGLEGPVLLRQVLDRGTVSLRSRFQQTPALRATLLKTMGRAYLNSGASDTAANLLRESADLYAASEPIDFRNLGNSLGMLGSALHRQGRFVAARSHLEHAAALHQEHLPPGDPDLGESQFQLGSFYVQIQELDLGKDMLEQTKATFLLLEPRDERHLLRIRRNLANVYRAQGQFDTAAQELLEVLQLFEQLDNTDDHDVAATLAQLGHLRQQQERHDESEAAYLRAIEILRTRYGSHHPILGLCLNNLGALYTSMERWADAREPLEEALAIKRHALGADNFHLVSTLRLLAQTAAAQGELREATELNQKALQLFQAHVAANHPEVRLTLELLIDQHAQLGDAARVRQLQRQLAVLPRPDDSAKLPGIASDSTN